MKTRQHLWKRISYLGVVEGLEFALARRVILSNQISLIFSIASLLLCSFWLINQRYQIVSFLVISTLVLWLCLLFNYLRVYSASRIVVSLILPLMLFTLSLNTHYQPDSMADYGAFVARKFMLICCVVVPLALFTWREYRGLYALLGLIWAMGFGLEYWHSVLGNPIVMRVPSIEIIRINSTVFIATVIIFATIRSLSKLNHDYEMRTQDLLHTISERNAKLAAREQELSNTVHALQHQQEENQQQAWVAHGIALFGQTLPTLESNKQAFADILSRLVKYTHAQAGLLYTRSDTLDEVFKLRATYACTVDQIKNKTLTLRDGLAGQALANRKPMYLTELPSDYFLIQAGMETLVPQALWIIPLHYKSQAEGVLELSFVESPPAHYHTFVERVAEMLAIHFSQDRLRRRLKQQAELSLQQPLK